jgi:hypothetical protein
LLREQHCHGLHYVSTHHAGVHRTTFEQRIAATHATRPNLTSKNRCTLIDCRHF